MGRDINTPRTVEDLIKRYNFEKILGLTRNIENATQGVVKLENELNNILTSIVINLSNVLDSQSEVSLWFYSDTPTLENEPYTLWNNPKDHIGDIYYNQSTGYVYQFNETWERNTDANLVSAMALTNIEIDTTIDHERRVFFNTPKPPYSSGDWWIQNDGTLIICQLGKIEGEYDENDFISSNKYSATVSGKVGNELTVLKGTVQEITEDYVKFTDLATGGSTTIAGENISTGSIQSNNYVQNASGTKIDLTNGSIDTKEFKVDKDGNVTVSSIFTRQGLMSNLTFQTAGWIGVDYNSEGGMTVGNCGIEFNFSLPQDFEVLSAYVTLYTYPCYLSNLGQKSEWCYPKNIRIYKADDLSNIYLAGEKYGYVRLIGDEFFSEIEGAFGENGFTPKRVTDDDHGLENVTSVDIKNSLNKGYNILRIRSGNEPTEEGMWLDSGNGYAVLEIIGYKKYDI